MGVRPRWQLEHPAVAVVVDVDVTDRVHRHKTLLDRGTDGDVAETEAAIERLAGAPTGGGSALRDIHLLRLRALLARAHGDAAAYAHLRDRCRAMARTLGFEGHMAWAETMT